MTRADLAQRYRNGETIAEIAASTGRGYQAVRSELRAAGVKFRRSGRRATPETVRGESGMFPVLDGWDELP